MKTKRLSLITLTLGLALALLLGVFASLSRATPGNPDPNPDPNTHTVPLTSSISLTYDEIISAATVTSRTFAVHAMQTGLLTATHGAYSGTIVVTPTHPLHPGELVQATATTRTLNITGERPLSSTVWQFRASVGGGSSRFVHSQDLGPDTHVTYDMALGDLDGDGHLDAFVTNYNQDDKIWLNDGQGNFSSDSDPGHNLNSGASMDVALGDLDGDGDLDAFVATTTTNDNKIWQNDGAGAFTETQSMDSPDSLGVALGDLDGDGDLDAFVTRNGGSGPLQPNEVWRNDGTGTFTVTQSMTVSDSMLVALGDLDDDGDLDALVARGNGEANQVWQNDGTGTFTETQNLGNSDSVDVALGDLDDDGDLDAFITNSNGQANKVWRNDGGTLTETQSLGNAYSYGVTLGDLDGDGDLDAFVTNMNNQSDEIWLNDGTGRFAEFQNLGSADSRGVALGDVDGDGDLDVLIGCNSQANQLWSNRNRVTAALPAPNTHSAVASTNLSISVNGLISQSTVSTQSVVVHGGFQGRMDGDISSGSIIYDPLENLHPGELVQTSVTSDVLDSFDIHISPYVWQFRTRASSSSGAFGAHPISPTFGAKDSCGIALGDVNSDGHLDAVVANYDDSQDVYFNDGTGRFITPIISPTFGAGNSFALALGDVNNDGYLDAVVANWQQSNDVYLNNGIGGYSPHPISPTFGTGLFSWGIALGDINGDGYLDAVVANSGQGQHVYLNDGTGGYSPHPANDIFGASDGTSRGVSLGDVDSDGDLDALVAHISAEQSVYLNDGAGGFSPHPISPTFGAETSGSWDIALGDVNGDGHLDAIVANDGLPQDVYLNNGTGGFSPHTISPTFGTDHASYAVALGDVDGDGDLDAIVANNAQPQDVYLNDGTGRFVAQPFAPTFGSGSAQDQSRDVALGDIDGDGDLDALIANQTGYAQTVWLNRNLADLSIAKAVNSAFAAPGVPLTFTLTFTNHGPHMATRVIISDVLPDGLWSVSSSVQITPTPAITYQWQIDRLAPGQGGVITISGLLVGELDNDDVLTNRATITTTDIDTNTLYNHAAISVTIDTEKPTRPTLLGPANNTFTRTNALTLAWSASPSADAVGYLLQLQAVEMDLGNVTTYSTGILLDGAYTWTVAAFDALAHTSPYTTPWSFSIDSTPPVPPELIAPWDNRVINDPTPTLVWASSASTDTTGYLLNWNGVVTNVGNVHNVTLAPLDDGPYTWTVAAFDALGNIGDDADSNSFTLDTIAPDPPALFSPADGALIHSSGLTLTWSASPSPDVAGYRLNWNGNELDTHSATQYTVDPLYNGPYTWTVSAYDNASNSGAFTTTWSFQVDIIAPPALRLIKSVDLGGLYEAPLNGIVTYTLVLSNSGEGPADDVTLLDELAPGLSFESWVEQGEAQLTPAVQWGPRDIAARSAHTISFAARVSTSAEFSGQSINNSAYFEAANAPSGSDSARFYVAGSPRVLAVSPPNAAQDVSVEAAVVVTFSKLINASSLVVTGTLPNPGGLPAEWNSAGDVVTLSHALLARWTTYTVGLDAADMMGNKLYGAPYTWHFVTERYTVYLPLALKLPVYSYRGPSHSRR